jgi:hypothetical protein
LQCKFIDFLTIYKNYYITIGNKKIKLFIAKK